jgi:tetrahydromethanopterin:alpha-L-glutamate ligase
MSLRVALLTEESGWHTAQLTAAFAGAGLDTAVISLRECAIDIDSGVAGLRLPGFADALPAAVFVRCVPGGSFEQVTTYLGILHALRDAGVPVVNDPLGIERSVDKGTTSLLLHRAGIPTPPTWVFSDPAAAAGLADAEFRAGHEVVQKPLFGSQGKGVRRLSGLEDLHADGEYQGVYYLQRFIAPGASGWRDWRVFVIDGQAVAAMRREGRDWVNNVAMGGACRTAVLEPPLRQLAEAATRELDLDYAGVDLLRDADGRWWVVEVNSIPAWHGLQSVCPLPIAERLAQLLRDRAATLPLVEAAR